MKEEIEILRKHKGFFLNYKRTFIKHFTRIYSELNLDVTPNDKIDVIIASLYDNFFPFEVRENSDGIDSKFLDIREKGIDVKPILLETFFIMTRDFVNGLSPKENNIIYLRSLINIIEGYMNVLDEVYNEENREASTTDIIKGLKLLEKDGKEVKLVNFYKGILVKYNASILSVDEDEVILQIHKYQGLVIEKEKRTVIESDIFPKFVMAKLVSIDKAELKATLKDLVYVKRSSVRKRYMRINRDPR